MRYFLYFKPCSIYNMQRATQVYSYMRMWTRHMTCSWQCTDLNYSHRAFSSCPSTRAWEADPEKECRKVKTTVSHLLRPRLNSGKSFTEAHFRTEGLTVSERDRERSARVFNMTVKLSLGFVIPYTCQNNRTFGIVSKNATTLFHLPVSKVLLMSEVRFLLFSISLHDSTMRFNTTSTSACLWKSLDDSNLCCLSILLRCRVITLSVVRCLSSSSSSSSQLCYGPHDKSALAQWSEESHWPRLTEAHRSS